MAVSIRCSCGKLIDADEQYRGQPVQCPYCKAVVLVPAAMATSNPVNTSPSEEAAKARKESQQNEIFSGIVAAVIGAIMWRYEIRFGGYLALGGCILALKGMKAF